MPSRHPGNSPCQELKPPSKGYLDGFDSVCVCVGGGVKIQGFLRDGWSREIPILSVVM